MTSVINHRQAHELAPSFFTTTDYPPRVMFGLQIGRVLYPTEHGAYFVTSTRRNRAEARTYQVRFIDGVSGKVVTVATDYQSNYGANSRAKSYALTYQHGCQLCRKLGHSPSLPCLS